MEGESNQEKLSTQLLLHNHHDHKGGVKTMPFIIANEAFERVASYGLMPNMIFYLMQAYHLEAATGTSILSIWSALSNALSIFGAFISDSYLGRFRVILLGSLSTLLGMTLLWFTSMFPQLRPSSCDELDSSCIPPTPTQLALLLSSFGLISIGAGCIRPCSIAFGADQLKNDPTPNNQRVLDSYFNWYYASMAISSIFALTLLVYIQDHLGWQVGFAVPVFLMVCSALMFLLGSSLYVKVQVMESPFSGFIQVLMVAFKNRKICLGHDDCYHHSNGTDQVELTENLRFLNKACVVRDLNVDASAMNPWSFCTVEKVESLKSLLQVIPMWSTGILHFVTISQNFPTLQAETMNRHVISGFEIPAGSFNSFMVFTVIIWVAFYDRILVPVLANHTHQPRGLHPKTRMGIGLVISAGAMAVSAIVETLRRHLAESAHDPNTAVDMSAMWLVPQLVLLGIAEAFNGIGQIEFYYSELPKSMSSLAMAVFTVGMAVSGLVGSILINVVDSVTSEGGKASWLSSNINEGHLDYYYWLLGLLSLLNFFYFLFCGRVHRSCLSKGKNRLSHDIGEHSELRV